MMLEALAGARVVALRGDADTLDCIAGAVAGAVHGIPRGIAENARSYLSAVPAEVLARFEALIRASPPDQRGQP